MKYLTAEQVLFIHSRIVAETGGSHGLRDLGLLESAIARPQATFDGHELYEDLFQKTAAFMFSLINNHPFVDGNKRTGVTAAGMFLRCNGMRLSASQDGLVTFTMQVAQNQVGIPEMAAWLREHAVPA